MKKHTSTHHEGKTPKAIDDEKQLKIHGFLATVPPSPPPPLQELPPPPLTDESAIHSESSEPSGRKDEFPHVQTQPSTDVSAAVFQNINIRLQSIETKMILLMSKCIINEAEPAVKRKYYNFNSTRKYRYIEFRPTNASMSFCGTHRNILPVPQIYL